MDLLTSCVWKPKLAMSNGRIEGGKVNILQGVFGVMFKGIKFLVTTRADY